MDRIIINVTPNEYSRLSYTIANEFEPITLLEFCTQRFPIEIKCQEEPNINSPEESFQEAVEKYIKTLDSRNYNKISFEFSVFSGKIYTNYELNKSVLEIELIYKNESIFFREHLFKFNKIKSDLKYHFLKRGLSLLIQEFKSKYPELSVFIPM